MDTRSSILDAALAVFVAQGYEATTMQAIRERAGVSNGSLFHFFRSKEALGAALYQEGILTYQGGLLDLLEGETGSAEAGLRAFVSYHLGWVEENQLISRFLFERGHPDWGPAHAEVMREANASTYHSVGAWLKAMTEKGQLRPQPLPVVMALLQGATHALCRAWLEGSLKKTRLTDFTEALASSLWAALRNTAT